jgi:CRISPR-associated protein Csd1
MSWLTKLYETYEQGRVMGEVLGWPAERKLMPISHTLQNAHINIVIDGDGQFISARALEKTQVVLPATEQSAGRSSGEAPHPLADKVQYVAGDYGPFGGLKKAYFTGYQAQLKQWCESEFGHPAAKAVLAYVSKGAVVADLVAHGVMPAADGVLLTQWVADDEPPLLIKVLPKEKGKLDQGSALVCWTVQVPGQPQADTWTDPDLQQAWVDFNSSRGGASGLCFVKGEVAVLATNHPAKIRHTGDKAKLISANDINGFTYRGRFLNHGQANAVSYDVTQKAHNALRWLISNPKQAFRNGDQVYVSWAVSGKAIPQPSADMWDIMAADFVEEKEDHGTDLGQSYGIKLKRYMQGYLAKGALVEDDSIVLMGLDSATPGRMGIIYYRETTPKEFIETLTRWHEALAWPQRHKIKRENAAGKVIDKVVWPICAPAPYKILDAVYGDVLKSSDTLKKNLIERLMPCIIEGRPLPDDIVKQSLKRATNRVAYKSDETWLWEQNVGIACALYKGFCKRHNDPKYHKDYAMALEHDYRSRDYLYGRLLAVAEKIESLALKVAGESRLTTAERYMQRFATRPASTWLNISTALVPYQHRLKSKIPAMESAYKQLLDEVTAMFETRDFNADTRLSGEYLLGFHCQRQWLAAHQFSKGCWVLKSTDIV